MRKKREELPEDAGRARAISVSWLEATDEIQKMITDGKLYRDKRGWIRRSKEKPFRAPHIYVPAQREGMPIIEREECRECVHRIDPESLQAAEWRKMFEGCRGWRRELVNDRDAICSWGKYWKAIQKTRWLSPCGKLRWKPAGSESKRNI